MTPREALNNIKQWVEYITRLDYVEPIVRGEVKKLLYDAYHKTTPEFEIIEKELELLDIIKSTPINVAYLYVIDKPVYVLRIGNYEIKKLTEEEYYLLKEVLNK